MAWQDLLQGDPIPWLADSSNPAVRHGTLRDLLDRSADDPEVQEARKAIPTYAPVAQVLRAQKEGGFWIQPDYYLPKYSGTFWILGALGDIGLDGREEQIRRACEYMFSFQREHGEFCRRRRVAGKGLVWEEKGSPCNDARIVRFLIQFGYGEDPRTCAAVAWLLSSQRQDGTWDCGRDRRYGCLRATHDYLRAAVLDPTASAHPVTVHAAAAVVELLMEPKMSRYHSGERWTVLSYPYTGYGVISTLDALARLGYTVTHPKVERAVAWLLGRQLPNGTWPLDSTAERLPFDVGRPGQANKWLTLDALRVIKLLYA